MLLFGVVIYLVVNTNKTYAPQTNTTLNAEEQSKIIKVDTLKMSVSAPKNYRTEEQITFVDLISEKGKINISRIATNLNDIASYLQDFDSKRKIRVSSKSNGRISNLAYVERVEDFDGGPITKQKVYFIYVDGWVYSLSTSSPALFDDLDTIAQSFRYAP